MKVTFRNLGPIEEATLDLSKRLTVLVGKNNTGKTFLASAAYAVGHPRTDRTSRQAVIKPLIASVLNSGEFELPIAALEAVAPAFARAWGHDIERSLPRCIGTSRTPTVQLQWSPRDVTATQQSFTYSGKSRMLLDLNGATVRLGVLDGDALVSPMPMRRIDGVVDDIVRHLSAVQSWQSQPAERLGIHVFARELAASRFSAVEDMLESDTPGALQRARAYPWLVRDALVRDLSNAQQHDSPAADQLESLLGGKVGTSAQGEFELSLPNGSALSTNEVSSSVKSLASLVLQYRTSSSRDRLVLDEPEMSLHPDLQRKFARWLGRAVGEGVQFLIATHSDYIVRELSHLLMMHNAAPGMRKVMEENGYTKEEAIDPAHIEVLRLGEGRATPIEVDRHGFRVDTIDDELERISALSQDLFAVLDEPVEDTSGE